MESYVYIMTNITHSVLYTGITSDLKKSVWQHRDGRMPGFTQKYRVKKLVYYEVFGDIRLAIEREKQIKKGRRQKKEDLIASFNPDWHDLYYEI
jgi:putative endonuclease